MDRNPRALASRLTALVAIGLLVTSCASSSDRRTEKERLNSADEAWSEAIAAGDIERIFSFWSEDAVIYAAGGTVVEGKSAIQRFVRRSRESGVTLSVWREPDKTVVSDSADLGYTIGTYEFRGPGPEGQGFRAPGRYLCTWRKDEAGEWRCSLEIHSPDAAGDAR